MSNGSWIFPTHIFDQVAGILVNEASDEDGTAGSTGDTSLQGGEGNGDGRPVVVKQEPDVEPLVSALEQVRSPGGSDRGDKSDKICSVCGDKALGCNFDAISCESCKAFFRRNALKEKKTKCLFTGSCKIDLHTRRFCPHCRLQKCFGVGMKKDLILGDDERKRRMAKVQSNRSKRQKKNNGPTTDTPSTPGGPVSPADSLSDAPQTPNAPQGTGTADVALSGGTGNGSGGAAPANASSAPSPSSNPTASVGSGGSSVGSPGALNTSNMLCLLRNARSIFSDTLVKQPAINYSSRTMNQEEEAMLQELLQIYDLSFTADIEPLIHIRQIDPSLNQLVNQSSITVLRLIKFAKRLEDFARLPQDCQIGILKGTWIHILLLRSVSLYDIERDMWTTPRGEIPTEILRNATGFDDLHDHHVRYSKSIKTMVPDDLTIVILMIVIVLFSPESPHVTLRETVSNIQDKYLVLLKHYLETKYNYHRAADLLPRLMMKLKELNELAEIHGKYLLDVNPGEIEPIMLEILDLK